MTDSSETDERVLALLELLRRKEAAKIKKCGPEIAEAAGDDEPWFEPEQAAKMMNTWLDACIRKEDDEALEVTAQALLHCKVGEDTELPGLPDIVRKITKALDKPGASHLQDMLVSLLPDVKVTGDVKLYAALGELLKHPGTEVIHEILEGMCGHLSVLMELEDEEVAAVLAMTVDLCRHVSGELPSYKPGDMKASTRLACKLVCLHSLLDGAQIFCSACIAQDPSEWPKAAGAIAVPTLVISLKDGLEALKPKPKEEKLKDVLEETVEACQELMGSMPKPAAGASTDPVGDAKAYVKALRDVKDGDTLVGTMNMMMSATDEAALDVLLAKSSLETLAKALERMKKDSASEAWATLPTFLMWAEEVKPGALEPSCDRLADLITAGPPARMQPKAMVDTMADSSPELARSLFAKLPRWEAAVEKLRGSPSYEGELCAVTISLEGLPRALEGEQLEAFCRKVLGLARQAKGLQMEDVVRFGAISALRSVVARDRARLTAEALDWAKSLKAGDGSMRDAATALLDAYEGRSLEGAYTKIAEANERFSAACGDLESLKSYVDENVADLKDFVATVAKKLPVPSKFSAEPRYVAKMAMLLHFECQAESRTRLCALPEGSTFTTETLEWNRWLKLGLSTAKLGKSVLSGDFLGDVPGTVDQVKEMYKTYSKKDDAAFLKYVKEPFLTSEEQDQLLGQLRKAGFFKKFAYDAQTAKWACANCHLVYQRAGRQRTEKALEAAAKAVEAEGSAPLEPGGAGMSRNADGLQERASQAKDVAMEVKKVSTAWCSLFGFQCCAVAEEVEGLPAESLASTD